MTGARYCLLLLPAVAPAPPTALLSFRAAHDFLCAGRTRENRGTVCFDVAASAGGTPAVSRFQANSPKGAKLCGFHGVASVNAGRAQRMALFLADGRWPAGDEAREQPTPDANGIERLRRSHRAVSGGARRSWPRAGCKAPASAPPRRAARARRASEREPKVSRGGRW